MLYLELRNVLILFPEQSGSEVEGFKMSQKVILRYVQEMPVARLSN